MTEHEPQGLEQDNAIDEQREVSESLEVELRRLHELRANDRCGETLRGRGGVEQEEERREGVVDAL
jgi:hypothetical protein